MDTVFLALPTHDGRRTEGSAHGAYLWPTEGKVKIVPCATMDSLLAHGFNASWCEALNRREKHGITHFAMLHSDVGPSKFWLDVLIAELKRTGADVMAAVVPIKNEMGLTSTGLDHRPDFKTRMIRRLTMTEVMELPETFGAEDTMLPNAPLLINTGCWICDFTKPWVERMRFQISDMIGRNPETKQFEAIAEPEDWDFSRQMHAHGLKIMATRKVKVRHQGSFNYENDGPWGTWKTDETFANAHEHMVKALETSGNAPVYEKMAG